MDITTFPIWLRIAGFIVGLVFYIWLLRLIGKMEIRPPFR